MSLTDHQFVSTPITRARVQELGSVAQTTNTWLRHIPQSLISVPDF